MIYLQLKDKENFNKIIAKKNIIIFYTTKHL